MHGPFNAFLLAPRVGAALQALGGAIRYETELTARAREIAILELAVIRESDFEWYAHERVGRAAGLTESELVALRGGVAAPSFDAPETLVRSLVRRLALDRDLDDAHFAEAAEMLGTPLLMELVTLVGYYDSLALHLRVWRTPLPAGADPVFSAPPP